MRRGAADSADGTTGTGTWTRAAPARLLVPPPPPLALHGAPRDEELEQLLLAWYEAGYRAGRYVARLQQGGVGN
jgi:hypothetical protein